MSHSGQVSLSFVKGTSLGNSPGFLASVGTAGDARKHEILEDQGSKLSKQELSPH